MSVSSPSTAGDPTVAGPDGEACTPVARALGLPVAALIQHGRHCQPRGARFVLFLRDGRNVRLGRIANLLNARHVQRSVLVAFSAGPTELNPDDWRRALRAAWSNIETVVDLDAWLEAARHDTFVGLEPPATGGDGGW